MRQLLIGLAILVSCVLAGRAIGGGTAPEFLYGVNLGGPAVEIDGRAWHGDPADFLECEDTRHAVPGLELDPPAAGNLATMLRTFRWSRSLHLRVKGLMDGVYTVYAYAVEDNAEERFGIYLEGIPALRDYRSGNAGHWTKLGPWSVRVEDGNLDIGSRGGAANIAGVEIWRGAAAGHAILEPVAEPFSPYLGKFVDAKPRVVVMTDIGGDPDDQQSLVRFLLYANEFDVEGFCAGFGHGHYQDTRPELLSRGIDAYGEVYERLVTHDADYPPPPRLRELVKDGCNGDPHKVGPGMDSDASNWIIEVLERADPRPAWFTIWGGPRELAQALWRMGETKSGDELTRIKAKIRVHSIADQDQTAEWIKRQHPDIFWIYSADVFAGFYAGGDQDLVSSEWLRRNVLENHGALGKIYPEDADGKRGVKEGDTPSYAYLMRNGLSDPEAPGWGNWGGRFQWGGVGWEYVDAADAWNGGRGTRQTIQRWREAYQNDFAARLDWCVMDRDQANHAPTIVCNGQSGIGTIHLEAKVGETIKLTAAGSDDPDGNELRFRWWVYPEASSHQGEVTLHGADKQECELIVPEKSGGGTIHVILEATDAGAPPLTRYRRVVIQCAGQS